MTTKDQLLESLNGGVPTPEQAAQLIDLMGQGDIEGDPSKTGEPTAGPVTIEGKAERVGNEDEDKNQDQQGAPAAAAADQQKPAASNSQQPVDESTLNPDNAVILAKDGLHTISYQKLIDARNEGQRWKAEAEAANAKAQEVLAQLTNLQQQAQQRVDAGQAPTVVDNQLKTAEAAMIAGVDPAIFGDFSEEDLAKGIATLVRQQVQVQVQEQVGKVIAPIQAKQNTDAAASHLDAIYKAHPDADSLVESAELDAWINAQPSFARNGYRAVLDNGTTQEVIELFTEFKKATGVGAAPKAAEPDPAGVKAAAKAAIANAKTDPPVSLSEIPGGAPAAGSLFERLAAMDPMDLAETLAGMPQDQVDAFLNRTS